MPGFFKGGACLFRKGVAFVLKEETSFGWWLLENKGGVLVKSGGSFSKGAFLKGGREAASF